MKSNLAVYLRAIASAAEAAAVNIEQNKTWPGDTSSALAVISGHLENARRELGTDR